MVRAGRMFVSRLINNLKQFPPNGRRKVNKEIKKDMEWWLQFMEEFDGVIIMLPVTWNSLDSIISSDACLMGGGGWVQTGNSSGEAFCINFPAWLTNRNEVFMNELELITMIVALKVWKDRVKDKNILAYCDNAVSVEVVNMGRARNRFSQACLQEICYLMAKSNSVLKLVHISSENNRICDCLSRFEDVNKRFQFETLTRGWEVKFKDVLQNLFKFSHDW